MKPTTLLILRLGELHHSSRFSYVRDYFLGKLSGSKASKAAHEVVRMAHPDTVVERTINVCGKRLIVAVEVL